MDIYFALAIPLAGVTLPAGGVPVIPDHPDCAFENFYTGNPPAAFGSIPSGGALLHHCRARSGSLRSLPGVQFAVGDVLRQNFSPNSTLDYTPSERAHPLLPHFFSSLLF